jgi:hypothetical protein
MNRVVVTLRFTPPMASPAMSPWQNTEDKDWRHAVQAPQAKSCLVGDTVKLLLETEQIHYI